MNYLINTNTYRSHTQNMPLESTGMFFIPAHSTKIPVAGLFKKVATAHTTRGFQGFFHEATFQHIPAALECPKSNFAQQNRGFQPVLNETFHTFQIASAPTQICPDPKARDIHFYRGLLHPATPVNTAIRNTPCPNFQPKKSIGGTASPAIYCTAGRDKKSSTGSMIRRKTSASAKTCERG